jgi:hypothetical protein
MSQERDRLIEQAVETFGIDPEQARRLAEAFFACIRSEVREASKPPAINVIKDMAGNVLAEVPRRG